MKKTLALAMAWITTALLILPALGQESNELLDRYEAVSQALVADDLAGAQKAAADLAAKAGAESALGTHASELAKSSSLETARDHFKMLSQEAIKIGANKSGYSVATCPMVKGGEWLQKGDKIANPYLGKKMPGCGKIKAGDSALNHSTAGCCSVMTRS